MKTTPRPKNGSEGSPRLTESDRSHHRGTFTVACLLLLEAAVEGIADDAIHIAAACVHRIDYLLAWNRKHLAN